MDSPPVNTLSDKNQTQISEQWITCGSHLHLSVLVFALDSRHRVHVWEILTRWPIRGQYLGEGDQWEGRDHWTHCMTCSLTVTALSRNIHGPGEKPDLATTQGCSVLSHMRDLLLRMSIKNNPWSVKSSSSNYIQSYNRSIVWLGLDLN